MKRISNGKGRTALDGDELAHEGLGLGQGQRLHLAVELVLRDLATIKASGKLLGRHGRRRERRVREGER